MNARLHQARLSRRGLLTASAGASLLVSGLAPAPRSVVRAQDATPKSGGTYRLLGSGDIRSLDPGGAEGSEDWWSSGSLLFNRLYSYDAENTFFADLAADFPEVSDDGLVYTIPLREDAKASTRIRQVSVASLLADTILRISNEESVSSLFME